MKKLFICLFFTAITGQVRSQNIVFVENQNFNEKADLPPVIYKVSLPKFPGNENAFNEFLLKNIKFPERAYNEKIEGTLLVELDVEKTGNLNILKVIGHLGGGCEEEARRIINLMPCWQPAYQHGEAVKCKMKIPVTFKLIEDFKKQL